MLVCIVIVLTWVRNVCRHTENLQVSLGFFCKTVFWSIDQVRIKAWWCYNVLARLITSIVLSVISCVIMNSILRFNIILTNQINDVQPLSMRMLYSDCCKDALKIIVHCDIKKRSSYSKYYSSRTTYTDVCLNLVEKLTSIIILTPLDPVLVDPFEASAS